MKKKYLITIFLCLTLAMFSLFACGEKEPEPQPDAEKEPTVTITSQATTITTDETYTLVYTTENAKSVQVTVTEKSSITTGKYDKDTKVFSATEAGEYTLTVKATNETKTAEKSVVVTVVLPEDTKAPTLSFSNETKSFTTVAGTDVLLPNATATDNVDEGVEVEVAVDTAGATVKKTEEGYLFSSKTAGAYRVSYYACDTAENDVEEFIDVVVTPVVAETTVTAEENNMDNLKTSGAVYKENFADGFNGKLAKGLVLSNNENALKSSIVSTNESIAGNSLLLDYTSCAYNTNTSFFFNALDEYIKSGDWTISMDIKVLGGTNPGFYFSFIYDGDTSGDNQTVALGAVGETKTVTYTGRKALDSSKTWHFRVFTYTGDSNYQYTDLRIMIDNITISIEDYVDATATRTGTPVEIAGTQLDGTGYTITGADDNYTAFSAATLGSPSSLQYLYKNKLVAGKYLTQEQAANLTAANGFTSDYVIYCTTQVNMFNSLKELCSDPAYSYTVKMKVYSPSASGWHIFIVNGSGSQAHAVGMSNVTSATEFTATFDGNSSYYLIGLYNGNSSPLYIGDITISRVSRDIPQVSPSGKSVGYTVTYKDEQINDGAGGSAVAGGQRVATSDLDFNDLDDYNYAWKFVNQGEEKVINALYYNPLFEKGCKYEITIKAYVKEATGGLWVYDQVNGQFYQFTDLGTGMKTMTVTTQSFGNKSEGLTFYSNSASANVEVYIA